MNIAHYIKEKEILLSMELYRKINKWHNKRFKADAQKNGIFLQN
jgi:hypothetical protein